MKEPIKKSDLSVAGFDPAVAGLTPETIPIASPLPITKKGPSFGGIEPKLPSSAVGLRAEPVEGQLKAELMLAALEALKQGDFSVRLSPRWMPGGAKVAASFNELVEMLASSTSDLKRISRVVGHEGRIQERLSIGQASGGWSERINAVNDLVENLGRPVRETARVIGLVAKGDLSQTMELEFNGRKLEGEFLSAAKTVNSMVNLLGAFASEANRVAREVGTEGKLGGQAKIKGITGAWRELTDNVNLMASNLTSQVRNIATVTTAVANGDLTKKITVDVRGEFRELKETINTMVDQLRSFSSEVTRVAREVGSEGKLGGQAKVKGLAGTWQDLTDNVNMMASNLTLQVRNIAAVTTAVANGDLTKKITVDVKGEILELKNTVNTMVGQLSSFADEVTRVAREVGVEGKLGGQASVPGAAGTWKDLTENVNQLAANLTTQVRAIANVATAVANGDLTRFIKVDASGEVAALKDNVNKMIRNLKETTIKTNDQDWLKTNLARFTRMLQGQKEMLTVTNLILSELAPLVSAQQSVFYVVETVEHEVGNGAEPERDTYLKLLASYAVPKQALTERLSFGDGLIGQAALDGKPILVTNVPPDHLHITSGLGRAKPSSILILPVPFEGHVKAVVELCSFEQFSPLHEAFLHQLVESIGIVLHTIQASSRTEELLKQSQSLAGELQQTNLELQEKARLLAEQNAAVERANRELEAFNYSIAHDLRTPLRSMSGFAKALLDEESAGLSGIGLDYAKRIARSAKFMDTLLLDLLAYMRLGRAEMPCRLIHLEEPLKELLSIMEKEIRDCGGEIEISSPLDPVCAHQGTLNQILSNFLSNALKFVAPGRKPLIRVYTTRETGFVRIWVEDNGIGIAAEHHERIFRLFHRLHDSETYPGTGIGLAVVGKGAERMGGRAGVESEPGKGSRFWIELPILETSTGK